MNESSRTNNKVPKLHHVSLITSRGVKKSHHKSKLVKLASFPELKMKIVPKNPVRRVPEPYAPRAFPPVFGALPTIQIELRLACWKALDVYFPTQVTFSNLVSIFPSKSAFSRKYFLLVQKVAERWFSWCFWAFWSPRTWWNAFSIA